MALQISEELRFSLAQPEALNNSTIEDFLTLLRSINCNLYGKQNILETFKKHFCIASGMQFIRSSALRWADSDMQEQAHCAASNSVLFIVAFVESCDELKAKNVNVPSHEILNQLLKKHAVNYTIESNSLVRISNSLVSAHPELSSAVVERALNDAKTLISTSGASSALDRLHTALHGYLIHLCTTAGIQTAGDITTAKAFKLLRENHPALNSASHRSEEITRLLQGLAASVDALGTLRNKASLAHANELLEEPEATAAVNCAYTIFRYLQDSLDRAKKQNSFL
jgi:hypothetical protein